MKEQWKRLDNDAKLLVNVEEGNQLPIKINIPLSALTPLRDEFCCNRLLTVLRVCVLLVLLALLGWTATTLYFNYYDKAIPLDQENLENKFVFQSLVYKNKDAVETDDKFKNSNPETEVFRDSTKKALDQIVTEMKGFNERLDQLQVDKEQQQINIKTPLYDSKSFDYEVVTSDRSDQSLDSMIDELAKEMGLSDNELPEANHVENKPELGDIVISESHNEDFSNLKKEFDQTIQELSTQLEKLNIEQGLALSVPANFDENPEEAGYRSKLFDDFSYQPFRIDNVFWKKNLNEESELDTIIKEKEKMNDGIQKAFSEMLSEMEEKAVATVNVDESHNEDKEVDQVLQAVINSVATSNLDNGSEQQNEKEDKVEGEAMEEQYQNVEESFMDGLIDGFVDTLFGEENSKEDVSDYVSVDEIPNEDKVEKEMIKQHEEDEMIRQMFGESIGDVVIYDLEDKLNREEKLIEDESDPSLFEALINIMTNDDEGKDENNYRTIPFETLSGETVFSLENTSEDVSTGTPSGETVFSLENTSEDVSSGALFEGFVDFMLNNDENNGDIPTTTSKKNNYDSIPSQISEKTAINTQQPISSKSATEYGSSPSVSEESFESSKDYYVDYEIPESATISEGKTEHNTIPAVYISNQINYADPMYSNDFFEETTDDFHEYLLPTSYFVEPNIWNIENKEININEQAPIKKDTAAKDIFVEMIPSVEYVKKIEENPFIPKVAKMLEPIVGPNHELLIWYYEHKNLPYFLRGADKWKVFGAKLLYDSNIKDYPADATIVSGLTFEKVYGGAEYPSSAEEARSDLEQEIINRLILKSYLNKMLLEGNAEAKTLSQVIEQHNLEKLKELVNDPQELTYMGDFFQVDNYNDDIMIPVVQFDPFVDESREANEQRVEVIRAFEKSRNMQDEKVHNDYFDSITSVASKPIDKSALLTTVIPEETKDHTEDSKQTMPENSELLGRTDENDPSDVASESFGDSYDRSVEMNRDPYESLDDWLTEFAPNDGPIKFRR